MTVGDIVVCVFAVAFTLGALVLPFAIYQALRERLAKPILSWRAPRLKLGMVLFGFVGTLGLSFFAVGTTGMFLTALNVSAGPFWLSFLGQALTLGSNLFYWSHRAAAVPVLHPIY